MSGSKSSSPSEPDAPPASLERSPAWGREETVLLLDLYMRVGRAEASDPDVQGLSQDLRLTAALRGHAVDAIYRNPTGISMKLKAMAQRDPAFIASGRKGLRAVRIDAEVWNELAGDRAALAREVDRIRSGFPTLDGAAREHETRLDLDRRAKRTRGPAPSFGVVQSERIDSGSVVYVLRFEAPLRSLFGQARVPDGWVVAKLGRSNDIDRRIVELSAGLPPQSGLAWILIETVAFSTAGAAQDAEQRLLTLAERCGWSLGGEFVAAPLEALLQELRRFSPGTCESAA